MRYRKLGDAGIRVSAVALGGWINFGEGKVEAERAASVVEAALEAGVTFFDLADVYGQGAAERQMGALLASVPRHTLVVSTKVFWPMSEDVNDRGLSRKHIVESIHRSLERLGMDYVDLYFCHRPDPDTPIRETVMAMHSLIERGLVHYWGSSEWSAAQIVEAQDLAQRYGWHAPVVEQPQYSMLRRERVEGEILPVTGPRGIGLVAWSPLAMGLLTGKYDEGLPEGSRFAREDWARERYLGERDAERVRRLAPIAEDLGVSRAQLALAWALRDPGVSAVIVGATRPEQLRENAAAAELDLDEQTLARIEDALGGGGEDAG